MDKYYYFNTQQIFYTFYEEKKIIDTEIVFDAHFIGKIIFYIIMDHDKRKRRHFFKGCQMRAFKYHCYPYFILQCFSFFTHTKVNFFFNDQNTPKNELLSNASDVKKIFYFMKLNWTKM